MMISNQVSVLNFKVNIFHLILMVQFVFVSGGNRLSPKSIGRSCAGSQHDRTPLLLDHVRMGIDLQNDATLHVDLTQARRVLANENLPIWNLNKIVDLNDLDNGDGSELERNNEVMEQLGKFTFYQEAETSSAAVYFHKLREFDGMIGYDFLIQKLSVDKIHPNYETLIPLDRKVVFARRKYTAHRGEYNDAYGDNTVGVNYQNFMQTYGGRVYDGYPEVLVIVSWDVARYWTQNDEETDHYIKIVSRVLTLFNGVDMLFSKLENTNVQLNIAGIIIATAKMSFRFLRECYHGEMRVNKPIRYRLLGTCVNRLFARYLHARRTIIPQQSYDLVIFLTRERLYEPIIDRVTNQVVSVKLMHGTARCTLQLYKAQRRGQQVILVASTMVSKHMGAYPTVAHEMAHLMTVLHDRPPYLGKDGRCSGHLMKLNSNRCTDCLSWSESSETSFKLFFSSPNCCSFINEPLSLHPSGRQQKLTADEQCRCYGYESAKVFEAVPEGFCRVTLQCKGADNVFHDTMVPMDGTPCDNDKVCWQMTCQEVQIFHTHL